MKKWLVAFAVILILSMVACFALADDMVLPDWRDVVSTKIAEKGQTVTISTRIKSGSGYEAVKLVVKDTYDWVAKKAETKNITSADANGKLSFSFSTSGYSEGHIYSAELIAIPTGKSDQPDKWEVYWDSTLTVVPAGTTGPHLYLNKTEMETGYYGFYVTAYDPDATNVWIITDGSAQQGLAGNSLSWIDGFEEAGSHTVGATFMYADGTRRSVAEQAFTVVSSNDPALYAANVMPVTYQDGNTAKSLDSFPESIKAGKDISYTIYPVTKDLGKDLQGLDQQIWYDSWLDDTTDWDASMELPSYQKREEPEVPQRLLLNEDTGARTVTISKNKLQVGHTYQLHVEISSSGRTRIKYAKTFVVLPATMNNGDISFRFAGN